ncbi:MAG: hypothetical protein WD875_17210 [Pirellulales bacterium]
MKFPNLLSSSKRWKSATAALRAELAEGRILAAQTAICQIAAAGVLPRLADAELRVFSQFGDDGIIQYLARLLDVQPTTFVEFGVENYTEANSRFLLINNNWRGLILDANVGYMESVRRDSIYWRHDLTAVAAFIDRDNINGLISDNGFRGDLGILSIDIDGNDYWVWERIDVVRPTIVIAEYNSVFGGRRAVSVPYDPAFYRTTAHYSNLYWGCSLAALCVLAERKGYGFVGCNSAGNNAYFVRNDRLGPLRPLTAEQGYVESRFRESRDTDGNLTYLAGEARRQAIAQMSVVDVASRVTVSVGSL